MVPANPLTYAVDLPGAPEAGPCSFPTFVSPHDDNDQGLEKVIKAVLKAKKVSVVVGAGISTAAAIPDFRSSDGLFATLKERFPSAKLSSGKDLFDVAAWKDPATLSLHLSMLGELHVMCEDAEPTPFHHFLKRLDDEGKLSRVYTQNIDGLERKVGLSYGVPSEDTIAKSRTRRKAPQSPTKSLKRKHSEIDHPPRMLSPPDTEDSDLTEVELLDSRWGPLHLHGGADSEVESVPSSSCPSMPSTQSTLAPRQLPTPRRTPRPAPVDHFARVIPLHGDLRTLACPTCKHVEQMADHIDDLCEGEPVPCPQCSNFDNARAAAGARTRGVALLKSGVVLYGEEHTEGERVGAVTSRDLGKGRRPDLLIVAGTTLKIPGTKKLVRELSKVIRPPPKKRSGDGSSDEAVEEEEEEDESADNRPVHTIFLNNEFLSPATQWKDTFDVWVRGDVQDFVALIEKRRAEAQEEQIAKALEREAKVAERQAKAEGKAAKAEERAAKAEEKAARKQAEEQAKTKVKGKKGAIGAGKGKKSVAGLVAPRGSQTKKAPVKKRRVEAEEDTVVVAAPRGRKPSATKVAGAGGRGKTKGDARAAVLTQHFTIGKPGAVVVAGKKV